MMNTPPHFTNGFSSCIVFCTSYLTTGITQSIYNVTKIPYKNWNFGIPLPITYYMKKWDFRKANTEDTQWFYFIPDKTFKFDFEKPAGMSTEINSYLNTIKPPIIIKICWLIQQLSAPELLKMAKKKIFSSQVLNLKILKQPKKPLSFFKSILK